MDPNFHVMSVVKEFARRNNPMRHEQDKHCKYIINWRWF